MHLMQAHARALGVEIDANEPFLSVPSTEDDRSPDVILALTPRYRALTDEFVRELGLYFESMLLVGIPEEWRSISGFDAPVRKCKDFLELAQLIERSQLFIGNPSLASAIAEGLKTPRLVDLPDPPNAFPIGPRGYVLPTRHADFLDIVRRLWPDNPRINSLYTDLNTTIQQLTAENNKLRAVAEWAAAALRGLEPQPASHARDALSLLDEAQLKHATLRGGPHSRFEPEQLAIYLHPTRPGEEDARARFPRIDISGFNAFECNIHLSNEHAQSVCFVFRLYNSEGLLLAESSKEVEGATLLHWRVQFIPIYGEATVELVTRMSESATSDEFAWAWFRNPRLVMG
jgi:hypothetical protein